MKKGDEVLNIKVMCLDEDNGLYQTDIMFDCKPITLVGALVEVNYKINDTVNRTGSLPKNGLWTIVCEMIGNRLLEESKKM